MVLNGLFSSVTGFFVLYFLFFSVGGANIFILSNEWNGIFFSSSSMSLVLYGLSLLNSRKMGVLSSGTVVLIGDLCDLCWVTLTFMRFFCEQQLLFYISFCFIRIKICDHHLDPVTSMFYQCFVFNFERRVCNDLHNVSTLCLFWFEMFRLFLMIIVYFSFLLTSCCLTCFGWFSLHLAHLYTSLHSGIICNTGCHRNTSHIMVRY